MKSPKLILAITGCFDLTGGIAKNNLNVIGAAADLASDGQLNLKIHSFLDSSADVDSLKVRGIHYQGYAGDKKAFSKAVWIDSSSPGLFIFDHVGLYKTYFPWAWLKSRKSVVLAHGSEASWRSTRFGRYSYRCADLVLTNSSFTLNRMRNAFSGFRGQVCELGLPPDMPVNAKLPEPAPSGDILIFKNVAEVETKIGDQALLLVGRMDPTERQKGHYSLLEVLHRVQASFPDAQLIFAGPGDDAENLKYTARELGVENQVFIPGKVNQQQLNKLYQKCFAYVMPSRQEGFGLVYLEAMNWAKPCVACRHDGGGDVVVDDETGYLVNDPDDSEELTSVLIKLLSNPGEARRMGENGWQRLQDKYTSTKAQQRLKKAFAGVLS